VLDLLAAFWALLRERSFGDDPNRKLALVLLLSIIPAGIFGLLMEDWIDAFFRDAIIVIPFILVVGAAILWLAERFGTRERGLDQTEYSDAAFIGVAQALALFPGISRSGVTIAAGLFRGLEREAAARFAFLMGIPIIAGAGLWKMRSIVAGDAGDVDIVVLAAGVVAAAISGWLAIGLLLRYLRHHSTGIFIAYRLIAAVVFLVLIVVTG
jgi:undecaprenyl-diphosphatase